MIPKDCQYLLSDCLQRSASGSTLGQILQGPQLLGKPKHWFRCKVASKLVSKGNQGPGSASLTVPALEGSPLDNSWMHLLPTGDPAANSPAVCELCTAAGFSHSEEQGLAKQSLNHWRVNQHSWCESASVCSTPGVKECEEGGGVTAKREREAGKEPQPTPLPWSLVQCSLMGALTPSGWRDPQESSPKG